MKLEDTKIGMRVSAGNMFGLTYTVIGIENRRVIIEHRTGNKRMRGGKWEDEVFTYTVRARALKPA